MMAHLKVVPAINKAKREPARPLEAKWWARRRPIVRALDERVVKVTRWMLEQRGRHAVLHLERQFTRFGAFTRFGVSLGVRARVWGVVGCTCSVRSSKPIRSNRDIGERPRDVRSSVEAEATVGGS